MNSTFYLLAHYHRALLSGALTTIELAAIAWVGGLVLGVALGIWRASQEQRASRRGVSAMSMVASSIPVMVYLLWCHYPLQSALRINLRPFITAAVVFALYNVLTIGNIVRSAILDLPLALSSAAVVTGVPRSVYRRYVLIPLALRAALPGYLVSQVGVLHMTLFASLISVDEVFRVTQQINAIEYNAVGVFSLLALFYFCAVGMQEEKLAEKGGRKERNLAMLEEEERTAEVRRRTGATDTAKYESGDEEWQDVSETIQVFHCVPAAIVADVHHFSYYQTSPILPDALKSLSPFWLREPQAANSLVEKIEAGYSGLLSKVNPNSAALYPSLALKLAGSMASLPNKEPARRMLASSMDSWLNQHGVSMEPNQQPLLRIARMRETEDDGFFKDLTELDKRLNYTVEKEIKPAVTHFSDLSRIDVSEQIGFAKRGLAEITAR